MSRAATVVRTRLLGVGFIVLLAGLLVLSVLAYQKAFTPVVWVTLRADHTGMQLSDGADVKLRGVIVGEVHEIAADGQQATLRLALDPAATPQIPANVSARLLPKTLFGERYVELIPPDRAAGAIRGGAVIGQDRTQSAIELERVLDGALPLLQSIKPDKLAATLAAIALALENRGDKLGQDLVTTNQYLSGLNKEMPTLADDVRRLADVLDTYHGALPDLLTILSNATVSATTLTNQRDQLAAFLLNTTDVADTTRIFLDRYDDRIIQLGKVSRPLLELLAAYSPEYPCLLAGVVQLQPRVEQVFSTGRMHITLEVTKDQGKFEPGRDEPVYGAHNGPNCRGLPNPAQPYPGGVTLNDDYDYSGQRSSAPRLPVGAAGTAAPTGRAGRDVPLSRPDMGFAGTTEESALLKPLIAAATDAGPPEQVPDLAVLLWGPLLRGAVVNAS